MNTVAPLPTRWKQEALPNSTSYEERIKFHRYAATVWASLAKDTRDRLSQETAASYNMATRANLESFIVRALDRALAHYREADAVRRRGHK